MQDWLHFPSRHYPSRFDGYNLSLFCWQFDSGQVLSRLLSNCQLKKAPQMRRRKSTQPIFVVAPKMIVIGTDGECRHFAFLS